MRKEIIMFTEDERYSIMKSYLFEGVPLVKLYKDYKNRCSMQYFSQLASKLYEDDIINKLLLEQNPKAKLIREPKVIEGSLGCKKYSYWNSENEILFNPVGFEDLSWDEKVIYYKNN